jgi:hypothetical protein
MKKLVSGASSGADNSNHTQSFQRLHCAARLSWRRRRANRMTNQMFRRLRDVIDALSGFVFVPQNFEVKDWKGVVWRI